jgi:hypothetical protein
VKKNTIQKKKNAEKKKTALRKKKKESEIQTARNQLTRRGVKKKKKCFVEFVNRTGLPNHHPTTQPQKLPLSYNPAPCPPKQMYAVV